MGGKSSPPPPDYSGLERVAQQQLEFAKEQYGEMKPFVTRLATTMADAQQEQMKQARDYYDYQTQTFRPLERGLVQQAQEFDTEGMRQQLAARAMADAAQAFQNTQGITTRELARRGVRPDSGNALAMMNQNALGLASMQAGGATAARQQAEQLGYARKLDAAGLGRGLAGASTAAYGGATAAGQTAGNTMMSAGNQYMQGMQQGAGTLGTILNSQTSAYNAAMSQSDPIMGLIGTGIGAYAGLKPSDRRLKENIELVGRDERTMLPLYEFEYKGGTGKRFLGVMSDDVREKFPQAVFAMPDGYDAVNYAMLGIEMIEVANV